jgi:acetyl esterase/lipase
MGPMREAAGGSGKTAHALRSYARKLLRIETWRKLVTLRVRLRMVGKAVAGREVANRDEIKDETLWLSRIRNHGGPALLIYGTNDPETRIAEAGYTALFRQAGIRHDVHDVNGANHSFYSLAWEQEVMDVTEKWICRNCGV